MSYVEPVLAVIFSMHIKGSDHYLVMFLSIYYLQHFPHLYLSIFSDFNQK